MTALEKPDDIFQKSASWIKEADGNCIAITGAGISVESGIPCFTGKDGIWSRYSPSTFGNTRGLALAFIFNYQNLRQFLLEAASILLKAEPNAGHKILAGLEEKKLLKTVITQNIDNLHHDAGSRSVIEIHGNYFSGRCTRCQNKSFIGRKTIGEFIRKLESSSGSRREFLSTYKKYGTRCKKCNRLVRPDVVLFGEGLHKPDYEKAADISAGAKTVLVIGTSLFVRPASDFPYIAKQNGAKIIEINRDESVMPNISDIYINQPAGAALSQIARKFSPAKEKPFP